MKTKNLRTRLSNDFAWTVQLNEIGTKFATFEVKTFHNGSPVRRWFCETKIEAVGRFNQAVKIHGCTIDCKGSKTWKTECAV